MEWFAVTHSGFSANRCKMGYKSSVMKMNREIPIFLRDLWLRGNHSFNGVVLFHLYYLPPPILILR